MRPTRPKRGISAPYLIVSMTVLVGATSLGVDLGLVQLAKSQLRGAARAAAYYAAGGLSSGLAVVQARALTAASDNVVFAGSNVSVSLDAVNDVAMGTWDSSSRTFTSGATGANAVKISAQRSAARGNAIPLMFGKIIGVSTCDAHASAVAYVATKPMGAFIGYNGVTFKNNGFMASYNSGQDATPTQSSYRSNGSLGTNVTISATNNDIVHGKALLGPAGNVSGLTITGSTNVQTTALVPPTVPSWNPGTNPNSVPMNYTVSSPTVLSGGTYWFTSLTIGAALSFSGPAILYVNGTCTIDDNLTAYNSIPANLRMYFLGTGTFGDSKNNNVNITGDFWGPSWDLNFKNNFKAYGRAFFNTMYFKNNAELYYDETFGNPLSTTIISIVQ